MDEAIRECIIEGREFIFLDTLHAAKLRFNYRWDEVKKALWEALADQ